jgi:DNA (cytosine-5)-methyltransferase 1
MKIADLFCGAGLTAIGLLQYGEVDGFDIVDYSKLYAGNFYLLSWEQVDLNKYDFIWASPPCQDYSRTRSLHKEKSYPRLINDVREKLLASNKPFIIENVLCCKDIKETMKLCGCMFGLPIRRVRLFEANFHIPQLKHNENCRKRKVFSITGNNKGTLQEWRRAMGLDENSKFRRKELAQGVPIPYIKYIMESFLNARSP